MTSQSLGKEIIQDGLKLHPATVDLNGWLDGLSEATQRAYDADLHEFAAWLNLHNLDARNTTFGWIVSWLTDQAAPLGRSYSPATQQRKAAAVQSFLKFCASEGLPAPRVTMGKLPKVHRDPARVGIDKPEAQALWKADMSTRDRALIATMLLCGLRIAESLALTLEDIDSQQGARVLRVKGKGSKPRTAVLPAPAVDAIESWISVRGDHPGYLFSTSTGKPVDPKAAYSTVRRLGVKAGISGLHPHLLRATAATLAIDSGSDLLKVQTMLGHANPATTMLYVRGRDVVTGSPVHAIAAAILG